MLNRAEEPDRAAGRQSVSRSPAMNPIRQQAAAGVLGTIMYFNGHLLARLRVQSVQTYPTATIGIHDSRVATKSESVASGQDS
jgi:hypothetical protein